MTTVATQRPGPGAWRKLQRGMSLLELMVVVAIITIIASVGYPSYMGHITRANRTAAKRFLLQVADRQEQFFANHKRYADHLTDLGYGANGFMIDDQRAMTAAGAGDSIYREQINAVTPVTYTIAAVPQLRQAGHDTQCLSLTLTNAGQRGQTGPSTDCW